MRECFEEAGLLYAYAGEELVHFDSPVAREMRRACGVR